MRCMRCPIGYCKAICMVLVRWSLAISPRLCSGQSVAEWLEGIPSGRHQACFPSSLAINRLRESFQSREIDTCGCDRAIPNQLRRLWPRLSDFRHLLLNHRHGLRSQVPLMDVLPDATEPDHPEVQD